MQHQDLIPENSGGIQTNTESEVVFPDPEAARGFYPVARQRLLNINEWQDYAGPASARFRLTDENGREINRSPQKGDHFMIDVPAPGPVTGEGHDWVRIEEIEEADDFVAIRVRPAPNPKNEQADVAHFFSDAATSTFMVRQEGNKVVAGVYGRNEKPNTGAGKVVDKIRNTAIAAGAITGFSKLQWKSLVTGLVSRD